MKKTRFLALASLCSVLAGMPINAQEIKDSGAKKIGGVETKVDKESPNCKNKNELIKYVKWVFGALGTHELLSYFKGESGQFYEKPARFSIAGQVRKRKIIKISNALDKIGKLNADFLIEWVQKFDKNKLNEYKIYMDRFFYKEKLTDGLLINFKNLLVAHGIDENTIGTIVENFDLHLYYFKYKGFYGVKVVYSTKGLDLEHCDATVFGQEYRKFFENDKSVILISAAKAIEEV